MLRVALTGGIATGKSYVRQRLSARGIPTIDSDFIVHGLLQARTPVAEAVQARFGPGAMRSDGSVDRRALGRQVFSDPAARSDLEAIIHPRVYERINAWAEEQRQAGRTWVVADIPLLFETGRQRDFDLVIVTACAPALQRKRLRERDRLNEAEAEARVAAQWPVEDKVRLGDYVIRTDGTFEDTDRQVDWVVTAIAEKARA